MYFYDPSLGAPPEVAQVPLPTLPSVARYDTRNSLSTLIQPDRDSYDWCKPYPLKAVSFDATSLRATLASVKTILGLPHLDCNATDDKVIISVPSTHVLRVNHLFSLVSTFGLVDWELKTKEIILKAR